MDKKRNNGIDFAKIISMFMIVFLHFCLHGGEKTKLQEKYHIAMR